MLDGKKVSSREQETLLNPSGGASAEENEIEEFPTQPNDSNQLVVDEKRDTNLRKSSRSGYKANTQSYIEKVKYGVFDPDEADVDLQ